jgi:hypothetical protein
VQNQDLKKSKQNKNKDKNIKKGLFREVTRGREEDKRRS